MKGFATALIEGDRMEEVVGTDGNPATKSTRTCMMKGNLNGTTLWKKQGKMHYDNRLDQAGGRQSRIVIFLPQGLRDAPNVKG